MDYLDKDFYESSQKNKNIIANNFLVCEGGCLFASLLNFNEIVKLLIILQGGFGFFCLISFEVLVMSFDFQI